MKHVRDYFREGKVPKAGITCETEDTLFNVPTKVPSAQLGLAEREFLHAVRELSDAFEVPRFRMW